MKPCKKFEFNIPKPSSTRNQFSHIVSPVGAYMKNTGATPLMTTLKANLSKKIDFTASKLALEKDRSHVPVSSFGGVDHDDQSTDLMPLPGGYSSRKLLPKKAYISSNLKHVSSLWSQCACESL